MATSTISKMGVFNMNLQALISNKNFFGVDVSAENYFHNQLYRRIGLGLNSCVTSYEAFLNCPRKLNKWAFKLFYPWYVVE